MEPREIELQRANTVPKARNRKISAFDQISREDDIGEVEDDYNDSIAPSTSFRERNLSEISRQLSNANSGKIIIAMDSSESAYEYYY